MKEVVVKTESVQLNFYAVCSQDGKWLKSRGMGGFGKHWVDKLVDAKVYQKRGPAMSQVTWWAGNYPEYGTPMLVRISMGTCEFLSQDERVKKAIEKKRQEGLKCKLANLERNISSFNGVKNAQSKLDEMKSELEKIKRELSK